MKSLPYLKTMHLTTHHRVRGTARSIMTVGFLAYFLVFAAGIPMVTFLCGSGEQRMVCMMDDCEASTEASTHPVISSPDCCIPDVTRSELQQAVVPGTSHIDVWAPTFSADLPLAVSLSELPPSVDASPPLTVPLFLQNHSLLI